MKSELKANQYFHHDDATSTAILVNKLSAEAYNPVLLFKPYMSETLVGDDHGLKNEAEYRHYFFVGIQTRLQAEMMRNHAPKIICGDATHGLTAYGFQLFTLMVKDDTGKGYPVAYLITSNVTKRILASFFLAIRKRSPGLKITITMSDDDEATKGAYREAFGPDIITLLCQWHVPLAWKRNVHRIKLKEKREELLYLLNRVMRTKKREEFNQIAHVILSDYEDCKPFVEYLKLNYFNRPEEWASCFRNMFHDDVDTNMLLESLHNLLKTVELMRIPNRRVDVLIQLLLRMDENRFKDYK
jgi:hypothetical protein